MQQQGNAELKRKHQNLSARPKDYEAARGKLIVLDIETTPHLAYTFGLRKTTIPMENVLKESSILSFSWKVYGEDKVFYEAIPLGQKDKWDDKKLVKKLHKLLSTVGGVAGHNCVAADTPVLTLDLRWVPAGSLKSGDQLLGFDEHLGPGAQRMLRAATVTHQEVRRLPSYLVTLSDGNSVITTDDHLWLAHTKATKNEQWVSTSSLKPGHHAVGRYWKPWEAARSYEAGYVSGLLDGEGHLNMGNACGRSQFQLGFTQLASVVWDTYREACQSLGFSLTVGSKLTKGLDQESLDKPPLLTCAVAGGRLEAIRALGVLRPLRLLQHFSEKLRCGYTSMKCKGREEATVVSVQYIGEQNIAVLSTDTRTYFADGYAMHNCSAFDLPVITRRFFHHGLGPVPKLHVVDTLTMARETGIGLSNKLAYLTRGQDLEKSAHAKFPGMQLWMQYLEGNHEAYQEMQDYNIMDIRSNEVLLDRLKPYSNVYLPGQRESAEQSGRPTCLCGSYDLQARGFYTNRSGKYQRYRCNGCGKWLSSRLTEKGQALVSRNVLKAHNQ